MAGAGARERKIKGMRRGVRMRSALAAALVVAVVSVLAGVVLLFTARGILIDNANATARDRASQVAEDVATGGDDLTTLLEPSAREHTLVQVLDAGGNVIAASPALAGQPAMSPLRPHPGDQGHENRRLAAAHDESFRIVAEGVRTPAGERTVLVGQSLDAVDDGTEAIVGALIIGLPVLAVLVGAATFLFVGRSLRPVEAMRRQAASITSRNLHARLPVPDGDDEIAALAATMNTMLDRIESASAAQRRFVADASHELRSPLATIRANADLLEQLGRGGETDGENVRLPEAAGRSVVRIRDESVRMARLVEDLLLLARYDDGRVPGRRTDVDLDDLAYAERERLALEHPKLIIEADLVPARVEGDPDALQRALRNLGDNAARHAVTRVTISVRKSGDQGELIVDNDGPPIAPEDRERIFGRFVRLDDSRSRSGGGTGLGLPIARDIVLAHGGSVTACDRTEGAALAIRLPLST
jgi:signal transduction histidine kinase